MSKAKKTILGVHVAQRTKHTAKVQKNLSDYGCSIRTRIGLHEAGDGFLLAQRPDSARSGEQGRRTGRRAGQGAGRVGEEDGFRGVNAWPR
jgi:hypothetical protein